MIRSPKLLAAALVGLAVVAFLAFGVFGIHTAFIDETVNEENPFANVAVVAEPAQAEPAAESSETEAMADQDESGEADAMADEAPASETEAMADQDESGETEAMAEEAEAASDDPAEEPTPAPAVPQIVTLGTGMLVDHDHSGTGTATVLSDGTQTFLRFEDDFAVDNGPDLNVYLVRGADAEGDPDLFDDDFIDLGDLKGNIGAQNYEIPAGVDVGEYNTVVIWCVRFGVAFNAANLA